MQKYTLLQCLETTKENRSPSVYPVKELGLELTATGVQHNQALSDQLAQKKELCGNTITYTSADPYHFLFSK